ncbi:UNVERIFIED_ORG: hypothetical protein J2Y94_003103 [Pseudomonas poae]
MEPDQGVKVALDKRTQKFISGLDSAKSKAAADGIELTPEEATKAAIKRALGAKKVKGRKKKKGRGESPFLPGSFESSSR